LIPIRQLGFSAALADKQHSAVGIRPMDRCRVFCWDRWIHTRICSPENSRGCRLAECRLVLQL